MDFTYKAYYNLLELLKENGYQNCLYDGWNQIENPYILRHDIDFSLEAASFFSEIEQKCNAKATYFVMICTDFYNISSIRSREIIKKIVSNGGVIGLHFDESVYDGKNIVDNILKEKRILEQILDMPIHCVSMHRPSNKTLRENYHIEGMINSYSDTYFKDFKYVSDSRRNWRENIEEIIIAKKYAKLHILTHAFWYHKDELTAGEALKKFIIQKKENCYTFLDENIRDLNEFLKLEEVLEI